MHHWYFAAELKSPSFGAQRSSICLTVPDMALLSVRLQYLWERCKSSERERKVVQEGWRGKIEWDERGKWNTREEKGGVQREIKRGQAPRGEGQREGQREKEEKI